jgi:hypothetical protein
MKTCDVLPVALVLLVSQAWAQPVIRLKAAAPGARSIRTLPRHGRVTHFLLQFPTEPGPEIRQELERRGIRVLQYVPDSTLMVASQVAPDLDGLEVLSASALEPSDKISPLLADQVTGALLVVFHPDVEMAKARDAVRARGFEVLENAALRPGTWWSPDRTVLSEHWPSPTKLLTSCPRRRTWRRGLHWQAALERRPRPVR